MDPSNPNPLMRLPMGPLNPPFGAPQFPIRPHSSIINPALLNEQEQKKKEFNRGIFVSGFQKSVTTAMLQLHFSIKPIYGLRHPTTKFQESKGFAFIYYGSEDDALYVKKTLDRTAILKEKIRITRTVISQNISKMMIKLKTHGLSEKEIQENQKKYFNDENLEKQVQRIIKPLFGNNVQVNKIAIPHSKKDKKPLRYARVYFYVSNIKQADTIVRAGSSDAQPEQLKGKNEYERILAYINDLLRNDSQFSRYCNSEIYEYTKKNQSNVLHIKGIKHQPKEDPNALAQQIKEFFQKINPQWNIVNVYAAIYETMGAWSNVTFATYQQTIQAYEQLKSTRPKFRDGLIYGSLRNVKDPRTVVVSVVRKDATQKKVQKFLNELAERSAKNTIGEQSTRKYDFFSFNIIESKKFYKNSNNEIQGLIQQKQNEADESWIEINEVPRRLIIHFYNQFSDEDIKQLTNDIKMSPGYEDIFLIGDNKKQLRSSHQKGHVNSDGSYVKHTQLKGKRKVRAQSNRPGGPRQRNNDPNQANKGPRIGRPFGDLGRFKPGSGMPNLTGIIQPGLLSRPGQIGGLSGIPPLGFPSSGISGPLPGISGSLQGTLPPNLGNLSGNIQGPPGLSPLPGMNIIPGSNPLTGIRPVPGIPSVGSQPPGIGQQPPMMPGIRPPGFAPGLPGMNLPGVPGVPGVGQRPMIPGIRPTGFSSQLPGMGEQPNLPMRPPGFPPQK